MKRRQFLRLIGGTAVATGAATRRLRAQASGKMFRLCALSPAVAQLESIRTIVLPELAKAGFVEGGNLVLDARSAVMEKLPEVARDLVASRPDAIMGVSGAVIEQLKAATANIPIVMSFSDYDPVGAGFVASFARPGGNVTGIAMMATVLDAKRLNLLHEALPAARRIAVLAVSEPRHAVTLAGIRGAAAADGIEIVPVYAGSPASYPAAFRSMRAAGAQALVIVAAPEFNRDAEMLSAEATDAGLPTMCEWSHMAARGCMLGYGPSGPDLWRRAADFVIRILRGTPAAELPVEGPTLFEFAINLKTAKRLGVVPPMSVLLRADQVIE
jgi:putative ABC transport system substrate-binding protein